MQSKGFWVAFKPDRDLEGGIQSFDIHVFHRMEQPLHVAYDYFEGEAARYGRKMLLEPNDRLMLHTISFDQLNNNPRLAFEVWLTEKVAGKSAHFTKEVKLRPKTFFKKLTTVDWLQADGYLFEVFTKFPREQKLTDNELEQFREQFKKTPGAGNRQQFLVQKANMPDFIDLHAEKLFKSTRGKTNHEILSKQLRVCLEYLDRATHHNLHRVYIVHGYGKGRLRSEVHKLLDEYPHVISYNNDYHPKFGNGATEVILG